MQQFYFQATAQQGEVPIPAKTQIRVALFDDHVLMREQLASVLRRDYGYDVVATGGSVDEAVVCAEEFLPDLIVLDLNMPGDGLEGARRLFLDFPAVKSVMLSTQDDEHIVSTALSAGAYGFLAKGIPTCELANALARIHAGQSEMSSVLAGRLLAQQGFGAPWRSLGETGILEITDREEQILRRVAQGMTPDETGASIGLSGATVATVLTNILLKLHEHDLLNHALARLPGDSTA